MLNNSFFGDNTQQAVVYFKEVVWRPMQSWISVRSSEGCTSGNLESDTVLVNYEIAGGIVRITFTYRDGTGSAKLEVDFDHPLSTPRLVEKSGTDKQAAQMLYKFVYFVQMNGFYDASHSA